MQKKQTKVIRKLLLRKDALYNLSSSNLHKMKGGGDTYTTVEYTLLYTYCDPCPAETKWEDCYKTVIIY